MSRGYTTAFASTAPVAPATALPHGGRGGCDALEAIEARINSLNGTARGEFTI